MKTEPNQTTSIIKQIDSIKVAIAQINRRLQTLEIKIENLKQTDNTKLFFKD